MVSWLSVSPLQAPPPSSRLELAHHQYHVQIHIHGSRTAEVDVESVMFRRLSEAREIGRLPCRFRLALGLVDFPISTSP